jgi:hypothetical protein
MRGQLPVSKNLVAWSIAGAFFYWFVYKPDSDHSRADRHERPAVRGSGSPELVLIGGNDLYGKRRVGMTSGATGRRMSDDNEHNSR